MSLIFTDVVESAVPSNLVKSTNLSIGMGLTNEIEIACKSYFWTPFHISVPLNTTVAMPTEFY